MESLFVRVLTLSLTGSAVLLPLLLLAPRLRGRYAAGTLSVLWLVLALRMALPVPLSLPWTAVTVDVSALPSVTLPAAPRAPAEVPEPAGPESVEPPRAVPPAAAPEGRPLPLLELAAWVWLAGGLALVGYQGAAYLLARRRLLRGAQPGTEEERAQLAALAAELGLRRTPRLLRTGEADAPLVVGLGRPVLLLPGRPLPADEREVVLLHELTHLRRHDLAHKALLFVPCAVHWFNPLVWWMAREAGRTLELCCDARVVRGRDEAFRRRYGTALLHLAAGGRGPVLSTRFGGGGRLLRARLANLFQHRRRGAAAAGLVLAAALAVTSLAACEQRLLTAEEAMDALEESIEVREYDIGPGELEYCISFRLPEHSGPEEEWNLHIAGRAETEALGGISLHYFDGEDWTAEKTYGIYLSPGQAADLTELTMEVWPPHGGRTGTYDAALHGRSIDLRALLREHFYVDARGFSLALPEPWPDLGAVQALDGGGLLLYCRALGPECGGIAQLHIETEPLEVLTGRDTLLGGLLALSLWPPGPAAQPAGGGGGGTGAVPCAVSGPVRRPGGAAVPLGGGLTTAGSSPRLTPAEDGRAPPQ